MHVSLDGNSTVCGIFYSFQPCKAFLILIVEISETFLYATCATAHILRWQESTVKSEGESFYSLISSLRSKEVELVQL